MKSIVLYLHVHQPYRIRHYSVFETGKSHDYFDTNYDSYTSNERIIHKVAEKSYLPTNRILLDLLKNHPEFKLSLSITGTVLEQLQRWSPSTLRSFQELVGTGRVEIVAETYHHSLAFFHSLQEFQAQVDLHRNKIQELFGVTPTSFRNTELAYNNDLAVWADRRGYKAVLAEGWDPILGWRSPNFVYKPVQTTDVKLLLKNYKLSDDIAFRFGNRDWSEWPLNPDKFVHWINESGDADVFNLFMDYETFGEHQWEDGGIFEFLARLPEAWLQQPGRDFRTVTEAAMSYAPRDVIDMPHTVTWADTERDLTAWLGNPMQQEAAKALYSLHDKVMGTGDSHLINDWRMLTTSDHFYYMCTKWWSDGDVHAYFSPYNTPYEANMNFMNAWHDIRSRLIAKGINL
ncbi:glycoside hydrolase family 57 protein [Candidatus Saccharibacteria bacterium]|nr:glycoside hydrolase family 57 protein [Candidatus Saccharibacteria bacterium]